MSDIADCFYYFGRAAAGEAGRVVDAGNPAVVSQVVYEPVGVCGLIFPLLQEKAPNLRKLADPGPLTTPDRSGADQNF